MNNKQWRFAASRFGNYKGMSTGDAETFKKSPFSSFGREILQNSIDARYSDEDPTIVEFKTFSINVSDIPGIDTYKDAIRRCKEYWADSHPEYIKEYDKIDELLLREKIECLRISDFNTTGLKGIYSDDLKSNNFLALAKGSGVSEKGNENSGGSKGVGKNAAFLLSTLKMIFYSTRTQKNEIGYIGVADLISGYFEDDCDKQKRDYTQGPGYYSEDETNTPIVENLLLDKNFNRNERNGTDIYILGFKSIIGWEKELINSILDSFMAAIVRNQLEVKLNNVVISKDTIGDIISSEFIEEKNKANIISQYKLLQGGEDVRVFDIETSYGSAELYVLKFDKQEKEFATNQCVMIRQPLMKIKTLPLSGGFGISAMCIINDNELGKRLRDIENPQHIDWETKRLEPSEKKEMDKVLRDIRNQINDFVMECLTFTDEEIIDPYGAGEWLNEIEIGDESGGAVKSSKISEKATVTTFKENKVIDKHPHREDEDGEGIQPDEGSSIEDGNDTLHPEGQNNTQGMNSHPGDILGGNVVGDDIIFKKIQLSGVRYKFIALDKKQGKYRIVFNSPVDHKNCFLKLFLLDDANNRNELKIYGMECNGKEIKSDNMISYGPFAITMNNKCMLDIKTDMTEYFASEVIVICK